jgi:hypothetical protein
MLQKILEKFEFFPIRCRVQRAKEIFADCMKEAHCINTDQVELLSHSVLSLKRQIKNQDTELKLKTKASPPHPHPPLTTPNTFPLNNSKKRACWCCGLNFQRAGQDELCVCVYKYICTYNWLGSKHQKERVASMGGL